MSTAIIEAVTRRQLRQFVLFPFDLYRGNPYWVPPIIADEIETLTPGRNPAFDGAEAKLFLAIRGGRVVGRVAGIISHSANTKYDARNLRFGWFDVIDSLTVARSLLEAVVRWGRYRGMTSITGPQGFTGNASADFVTRLSIGLFVDSYFPVLDGVTTAVTSYERWLTEMGDRPVVVTQRVPGYEDPARGKVIRFASVPTVVRPPYRIGVPELDGRLRRSLAAHAFSLVHAHSPFAAGHLALSVARERQIPIVATFHTKFRDNLMRALHVSALVDVQIRRIVEFFRSVDEVWIPQESAAAVLRAYGYEGAYRVVENGVDFNPLCDVASYRARGAAYLCVNEARSVGLYVGQLIWEWNLRFLLESAERIARAVSDFVLVMVGDGPTRRALVHMCRSPGLNGRVIIIPSIRDRELLRAIYARGDLFLFPSLYDNAPLVVREAAAMWTPSVVLRGSTASEVIRDNANGFVAEPSAPGYASRVVDILRDATRRTRVARGAAQTLCRSWQSVVEEARGRYERLVACHRKNGAGGWPSRNVANRGRFPYL